MSALKFKALSQVWERWSRWWGAQPRRQQVLVVAALGVLGLGAIDVGLLTPAQKQQQPMRQQIARLEAQRAQQQAQASARDAEQQALRAEEKALRDRLVEADRRIAKARAGIAGPEALRQRMRELSPQGEVQVLSLTTQPAEPLALASRNTSGDPAPGASGQAAIYRMPVVAVVEGPYPALRRHLAALEDADGGLAWQSLALDNANWPRVKLELQLSLLSDRAQWKGP